MPGVTDLLLRSQLVLRACALEGPLPFGDVRARLHLSAATVSRLLRSLVAAKLLRHERDGRYAIAPGAVALALDLLDIAEARGATTPAVRDLADQTGASAAFWQLAGRRLILIDKHEMPEGFHYIDRFAHRAPEATVFGLTLLAALSAEVRQRYLRHAAAPAAAFFARLTPGPVVAGVLSSDPSWRVAAVVVRDGVPLGVVGISRAAQPAERAALRDRRCVAAAARRMSRTTGDA